MPNLRTSRLSAGLTQSQAARLLGVTRVTIARWESGARHITDRDLRLFRHLAGLERIPFERQQP